MKQNWEIKKLSEVCSKITDGTHKTPKYVENGIRFISIKNIKPFKPIDWNAYVKYISEEEHKELIKRCNPELGDILFPRIGTLGYAKKIDFEDKVSLFVGLGLAKPNRDLIDSSFLEYYLNTPFIYKLSHEMATGAGRQTLALASSKEFPVPVPPLDEQKRIVAKLDQCFEAIDKAKATVECNLQNAKELFQSQLNQIFTQKGEGWVEKKLGEVCEKTTNIKWQENQDLEFKYIDLTAVSRDSLQIIETVTVNSTNAPSRAKKSIKTNDVIFATTRPTLKRVAKITNQFDNQICSTGFVVLRGKLNVIEPEIIFYFLQSDMFMDRMESIQRGTSYPAVTDKDVKETILPFPVSNAEQKNTVEKLGELKEQTKSLESNYQQELDVLDELEKSFLQKEFNGEL